jgi:acetyl-CoA C-acetyltransferase
MADNVSGAASVIVAGARTPTGRFHGALSGVPATDLGAVAIRAAIARSGIDPAAIGYVLMGQVVTAGAGQNPARIAAVGGGVGMNVPAATVNNVCLSGMNSIVLADQLIRSGDYDIVVAGGMESRVRPRICCRRPSATATSWCTTPWSGMGCGITSPTSRWAR